ncbi:MAG: class I SAM-dependent methyltransferase [Rhodovibrionaceae bacterium]
MLYQISRLTARILEEGLEEAEVYRREALYRQPAAEGFAPGVLQCPLCGVSARRFLPFGFAGRRNARCPGCGSLERHRFLWLYLTRRSNLLNGRLRVLHTAPEPCLEALLRPLPNLRYRSVDLFNPGADIQADLAELPLPDASFDAVLSCHTLEHVIRDRAAMGELSRVLRPGGWAVIMAPFDPKIPDVLEDPAEDTPAKRMAAYGHPYHYRIYGQGLIARLAAAGLQAEVVASRDFLSPHRRRRFRINRNYLLFCRKL